MNIKFFPLIIVLCFAACSSAQKSHDQKIQAAPIIQDEKVHEEKISGPEGNYGPPEPYGPMAPPAAEAPKKILEPKLCLVLGPGLARGFAHAGVLESLSKAGISLQCIYGVEMGAVIGGLYSSLLNTNSLQWEIFKIQQTEYLNKPLLSIKSSSLSDPKKMQNFLEGLLQGRKLSDLQVQFATLVTDTKNFSPQKLSGDTLLSSAITASLAIPGIFSPFTNAVGMKLQSVALQDPLLIHVAREEGATVVVAVNLLAKNLSGDAQYTKVFSRIRDSSEKQKALADVVIEPDLSFVPLDDFSKKSDAVAAGRDAGDEAVTAIKAAWEKEQKRYQCELHPSQCSESVEVKSNP